MVIFRQGRVGLQEIDNARNRMGINDILESPEGRTLDFKRELPRDKKNILKTIVAFVNGSGGMLCVGIDDDRTVISILEDPFMLEEQLSSLIHDSVSPIPNPDKPEPKRI